jgi:hypothetical protein
MKALTPERRRPRRAPLSNLEHLPFVVTFARTEEQVAAVERFRANEYLVRHLSFASHLLNEKPSERRDEQLGAIAITAIDKISGSILGSMRISTNLYRPLQFEFDVDLPAEFQNRPIVYFSRFAVLKGEFHNLVRASLLKAAVLFCLSRQIENTVISVVKSWDRLYYRWGYQLLIAKDQGKLADVAIPVSFLGVSVDTFKETVRKNDPVLFQFIFQTHHPDFHLFKSMASQYAQPRAA